MEDHRGKRLYKRFEKASIAKGSWNTTYEEAMKFFSPFRKTNENDVGINLKSSYNNLFDSTGITALREAVSNAQSDIFPPGRKWGKLKTGSFLQNNNVNLSSQLESITDVFFSALKASNFDMLLAEFLEDWFFGTGNMLMLEGDINNPFKFEVIPLQDVYLERGVSGEIGARFRKWKMPLHLISKTWPQAKFSDKASEVLRNDPYKEIELIEHIFNDNIEKEIREEGSLVIKTIEGYKYILQEADTKHIILEEDIESQPWINVRYSVSPREVYGAGPVLRSLAEAKVLNKVQELIIKNASINVAGMYTILNHSVLNLNNIKLEPFAFIPVESNGGGSQDATLKPIPRASDINLGQIVIEDKQKAIKNALVAEPMGEIDGAVKTATEIAYRANRAAKVMGSAYGRMQSEGAAQIVKRGLYILEKLGLIDLNGFKVDGQSIDIKYVSPISQAQEEDELTSLTRFGEIIRDLFGQEALLMMSSPIEYGRMVAKLLNIPEKVLASEEQLKAIQQGVAEQQEQQKIA